MREPPWSDDSEDRLIGPSRGPAIAKHLANKDAETTHTFFKTVQNKLHWAITGKTAAELVAERADAEKASMGLSTWKNAPKGKIVESDVSVAKNYLIEREIKELERIVSMYLDYALFEVFPERNGSSWRAGGWRRS